MTHLPPPADEPSANRSDDPDPRRADRGSRLPKAGRRSSQVGLAAPIRPGSRPFAWQHGSRLCLLVKESREWVLAELEFVASECHYVEVRRTRYRWPREAIGVLLSRALVADETTARRLAGDITAWLAAVHTTVPARPEELES